jgi:hypothetical protein
MGEEFNRLIEKSFVEAWTTYRRRLMENFGILCAVMTPKDIMEQSMRIDDKVDERLRGSGPGGGGSPLDITHEFLSEKRAS